MAVRKQLYVLRHAKSSWEDARLDDHERPLSPRGLRTVKTLAEHFRANGIQPALVICSTARRARDTLDGVLPAADALIEAELYSASAADVLARLRHVAPETESVMVIGHNPALQNLVLRLADSGDVVAGSDLARVRRKFPTGGLATLSFECAWSKLAPGRTELTRLVRAKDLE